MPETKLPTKAERDELRRDPEGAMSYDLAVGLLDLADLLEGQLAAMATEHKRLRDHLEVATRGDYPGYDPDGAGSPMYQRCEAMRAERDGLKEQLAAAQHAQRCAQRMAAAICIAVECRILDSRSHAGDAMLDYLDGKPMSREEAWKVLDG